jgi:ribosomal protein S18 acetylase RimI-like enzyme
MNIVVREAVGGDLEALVKCHSRFMERNISVDKRFALRSKVEDKWGEQIASALGNPAALVLVAEGNGNIVGCAYTIIKPGALDFGPEKIGYLCDVFVETDYRRLGIARRFLSLSLNWLRLREIFTIEASWSVYSEETRTTWPALGFIPISISGQMQF